MLVKVVHITLEMGTGGLEVIIVNLAKHVDPQKFSVMVGCLDAGGVLLEQMISLGVKGFITGRSPGFDWRLILKLRDIFKKEKIQVVHTHNQTAHFYAGIAAKLARVPVLITTEHSRHNIADYRRRRIEKRFLYTITDKWVVVSDELRQLSIKVDGLSGRKLQVISNGVDFERFGNPKITSLEQRNHFKVALGLPPDSKVVIMVARLNPIKQHYLLIDALNTIKEKKDNIHLILVGDGECQAKLSLQSRKLGINEQVHFLGVRKDIPELLAVSDMFVLCSKTEGLPLSLLEACAAGVPILITNDANSAGIIEDSKNGTVVKGDSESLAKGCLSIFQNMNKKRSMATENKSSMCNDFSLEAMAVKYEKLYLKLLAQKDLNYSF